MKHLRLLTIIWLIGLMMLFNIEKLGIGAPHVIYIESFVYILGFIGVAAMITVPAWRRFNGLAVVMIWLGLFTICKFLFGSRPFFGGLQPFLTITEAVLLITPIWISHRFAQAVHEFEQAVLNMTLSSNNDRVRNIKSARADIEVEMLHSRNNNQPFSVMVVEPKEESVQQALHQAVEEVQQSMMYSYVINSMAQRLSKYLRHTDLILEQREQGRFIILCPNTNSRELRLITEYVETITDLELGVSINCGAATFTDPALTFEELIRQAQSRLHPEDTYPLIPPQRTFQPGLS